MSLPSKPQSNCDSKPDLTKSLPKSSSKKVVLRLSESEYKKWLEKMVTSEHWVRKSIRRETAHSYWSHTYRCNLYGHHKPVLKFEERKLKKFSAKTNCRATFTARLSKKEILPNNERMVFINWSWDHNHRSDSKEYMLSNLPSQEMWINLTRDLQISMYSPDKNRKHDQSIPVSRLVAKP